MASGFHFQGLIRVEVDSVTVQAVLHLEKKGEREYDASAIAKILADAGVKAGYDLEAVLDLIGGFSRSKEPFRKEIVARGELPTPPVPEAYVWVELPELPADWAKVAEVVLKESGPPEVFSMRKEKTVLDSGPGWRETREKVLVDPRLVKLSFVESGSHLAVVHAAQPGKPGTNLEGRPLFPPAVKNGGFFLGSQIVRKKTELLAGVSGFLRLGKNWAEIIPFEPHRWKVAHSSDRSGALLSFYPGHPFALAVSVEEILASLESEGFSRERMTSASALQSWIDDALFRKQAFEARPLNLDRDASFEIEITSDRTKAFLNIEKAMGNGKPLVLKDLGQKLREAGLKGFSFEATKVSIMDFVKSPLTELKGLLLAEGKSPTRGGNRQLVYQVDFIGDEERKDIQARVLSDPKLLAQIPYTELMPIEKSQKNAVVKKGQSFAFFQDPEQERGLPGVDVFGEKISSIPGNDPPLRLLEGVQRSGDGLEATRDGLLEIAEVEQTIWMRVREHQDGEAFVMRSSDNLEAFLSLRPSKSSGRPLERPLIDEALKAHQVVFGLDEEKISSALRQALTGHAVDELLIAKGRPSSFDLDRRLNFLVPFRKDSQDKATVSVRAGDRVAEYLVPDGDNPDGIDVLGNVIPASVQEHRLLRVSDGLKIQEGSAGLQLIVAQKNGELIFDHVSLTLRHQIVLKNVDSHSGNVKFPGDVLVEGSVESGMFVMAGSVKVRGSVAGSLLSSDSNIQVAGGVKGDGKALLRAKKHVAVGFAERATLLAVGDLHVNTSLRHCRVMCNGKVRQKSPGGSLVGGLIKVKNGLETNNLGSPNGVPTVVSFGQDYLVEDQIDAEVKETDKLREGIVKLDRLMTTLTGPADKEKLTQARKNKVLMIKMLEKRNLKLINLRDKFDLHCPSEIIIHETLFPGVSIESHGRLFEVKSKKTGLKIVFNENTGHIEEQPLE